MQRNIIRFAATPPRDMTLVADGTLWPKEVLVDGEAWLMGEVVEWGPDYSVREYVLSDRLSPGQRLLRAISGSP